MPHDSNELCQKIKTIYPEIGECNMGVKVGFDTEKDAYVVDLEQGEHKLKTYLDHEDADACMDGKQCVHLGVDIAQLKDRINKV
jgi:alanyl-tRNA synthetase